MVFLNIRRIAVRRLLFFEDFYRYWKGLPKKKRKKKLASKIAFGTSVMMLKKLLLFGSIQACRSRSTF
jgi:hypothetical protein